MNDRNMYYNTYGYGLPNTAPPFEMPQKLPNTYTSTQLNDMNERINRLERQMKRIDQRLNRIETPYANNNTSYNNEPDNNMYMM